MPSNPTPTCADWYQALTQWKELKKSNPGLKKTEFLASDASGSRLRNCKTHANQFSINLKKFEAGTLENTRARRQRNRKFLAIEDKLIKYIDARAMKYARDKCGISWNRLKVKCRQWAHNLGIEEDQFCASDGWINNCLKRNNRDKVKLHGEGDELTPEEEEEIMGPWLTKFHVFLIEKNIVPDTLYNGDQTGLYHQKMPNTLYINKDHKKKTRGCKQMKDKSRLTLMVATSSLGSKIPIAVVGKSKYPKCFDGNEVPLPYIHQSK